jgi:hypothetical protein
VVQKGVELDPQVVETLYPGFQTGDAVPQTDSGRKLHGDEMHQLAPAGKSPGFPASAALGFQLAPNMSRNKFKHLLKDCFTMGHSPKTLFCLIVYG